MGNQPNKTDDNGQNNSGDEPSSEPRSGRVMDPTNDYTALELPPGQKPR